MISLTLGVLDAREVSLQRLLAYRRRSDHPDYRKMRLRYLAALERRLDRLRLEPRSKGDIADIEKQFKADLKDDLAELKSQLGVANAKLLFNRDVLTSIVIGAGVFLAPSLGAGGAIPTATALVGAAPLARAGVDYREARANALKSHEMSWLYLTQERRLPRLWRKLRGEKAA